MSVRQFELFHGAVLTKLVRSDRPVTLRMIETKPGEAWSTYKINDAVKVLCKHSTNPRKLKRVKGGVSWPFVISPDQLKQLEDAAVWLALICGSSRLHPPMEVCLLDPEEIRRLVDTTRPLQQTITVKHLPGRSLRASSARVEKEIVVPKNRTETWDIPGS